MSRPSPDAHLHIAPLDGLIDEPLTAHVHGFRPNQPITVQSVAEFPDPAGSWSATAIYQADDTGAINLDTQVPVSGDFDVADANALIWALTPDVPGTNSRALAEGLEHWELTITATQDDIVATQVVRRRPVSDDVTVIEVREESLIGNLYLPPGLGPFPTILVLGGSGGGFPDRHAALLASHGFAAFAFAYFGVEGLPDELRRIPLEYFETALEWLAAHPQLASERLAVGGISRGAELALLLASRYPAIRSVVAWVPSGYVWGAVSRIEDRGNEDDFASWTAGGKTIPYAGRVRNDDVAPDTDGVIRLTPAFLKYIADTERSERALIPVENINGPVLLISGTDDALWPSARFGELIVERLQARGFDFPLEHLTYEGAGHSIGVGYGPTTGNRGFHPIRKATIDLGGTPAGLAHAREDSWPRVLDFFRRHATVAHPASDDVAAATAG